MNQVVLDKNHKEKMIGFENIEKILENNIITSVTYEVPSLKIFFFKKFFSFTPNPIIYLDFDLLLSGFVLSGYIQKNNQITFLKPEVNSLDKFLKQILMEISKNKIILIIDSLDTFYSLFYKKQNLGRWVESVLMLLTSFAQFSNSKIIFTCSAFFNKNEGWVLKTSGRNLPEISKKNQIHIESFDSQINLKLKYYFSSNEI